MESFGKSADGHALAQPHGSVFRIASPRMSRVHRWQKNSFGFALHCSSKLDTAGRPQRPLDKAGHFGTTRTGRPGTPPRSAAVRKSGTFRGIASALAHPARSLL